MRILAFSDLHGDFNALKELKKKSKRTDLVVCAGDISNFEHNLNKLLEHLNSFSSPVLIIHGNHEGAELMKELCADYSNLVFIHRAIYQLNELQIVGYGGGGFSIKDNGFEEFAKRIKNQLSKKFILVTHAPPYGTKLDLVLGEHKGNKSIRNFIVKYKPLLAISGHLHENANKTDILKTTKLINPSKHGYMINV